MLTNLGNLCIEGHNYRKVFTKLSELNIGDSFYLLARDGSKVTYVINELIHNVAPNDMSHIAQNSDNVRHVTLITCDPRRSHKILS